MPDDLTPRVDLLERLQAQQEQLNALLIEVTARLTAEQGLHAAEVERHAERMALLEGIALRQEEGMAAHDTALERHAERMARYDAILTRLDAVSAQHEERMAELRTLLVAIKDMLPRGNGH